MAYVNLNVKIDERTRRVLGVVKERYGLNDAGEALDKFTEIYGDEFVEREVNEDLAKEIIRSCDEHMRKHGLRKMSLEELRKICGA